LRTINSFATILANEYGEQLPPEAQDYLARVGRGARKMGQLIDELLALSRLSRHHLVRQALTPAQQVQEALEELQADQQGRLIQIMVEDLPDCSADPTLLKQLFLNLLANALKFTRTRAQAVIEVGAIVSDGTPPRTVYYVRDNGVGFDMRYADKLFAVFQRLHTVTEYEGSGVGLATVQRIVQRHGGRVWADSTVNGGATFYFTLGEDTPDV
jgi:light-regulated signal transduction histidine kinase (bacteriophytochrome)